jgi:hypothetical protein
MRRLAIDEMGGTAAYPMFERLVAKVRRRLTGFSGRVARSHVAPCPSERQAGSHLRCGRAEPGSCGRRSVSPTLSFGGASDSRRWGWTMVLIRLIRLLVIASVLTVSCGATTLATTSASSGAAAHASQAASAGPQCTFNGSSLPLVTGVSAGSKIAVNCSGLPPLHPYLMVGTSLVLAIDPAAAPLLSGQLVSLSALMALLAALKEIDLPSAITPISRETSVSLGQCRRSRRSIRMPLALRRNKSSTRDCSAVPWQ